MLGGQRAIIIEQHKALLSRGVYRREDVLGGEAWNGNPMRELLTDSLEIWSSEIVKV